VRCLHVQDFEGMGTVCLLDPNSQKARLGGSDYSIYGRVDRFVEHVDARLAQSTIVEIDADVRI
jgi:hypothetical protein